MKRIRSLQKQLKHHVVDALIIDDITDLYYLTGLSVSVGRLLVTSRSARLFLDGRYYEEASKTAPCPVILTTPAAFLDYLRKTSIAHLGFDGAATTVEGHQRLKRVIGQLRRATKRTISLKPLHSPIAPLRMIKDSSEQLKLRTAARLGNRGFDYVKTLLRPGVTEAYVAAELEIYWRRNGGQALAFDPIIAFGPNTSKPHYSPGSTRLRKGQPVLIDIGVTVGHYHSDMTRVVFVGNPKQRLREVYLAVLAAQKAALTMAKPGVTISDLDKAARDTLSIHHLADTFTHSLGHGIGLAVHEAPILRQNGTAKGDVLQPGMVITIEPGSYLPGIGGVRIEDTIIITPDGHDNLTTPSKRLTVL